MRVGVGFSHPRTWNPLTALIRWVTGSKASHCFLVYDDGGLTMVRECHLDFRDVPMERFQERNAVVGCCWLTQPGAEAALRETSKWLGVTYDFTGLAGELVVYLGRALKKRWHNPVTGSRALFCSEAVVRFLQLVPCPGADALSPDDASPEDVLVYCRTLPWSSP